MKTCYVCNKPKDPSKFKKDQSGKEGRANICKKCHSIECYRKRREDPSRVTKQYARTKKWQDANPDFKMLQAAKRRAAKAGIPFRITRKDILIPEFCPVLGIPLVVGGRRFAEGDSPSLDKIIPELGYVPGNVAVISHKANTIKSNSTVEELEAVVRWLKEKLNPLSVSGIQP